MDSFDNVNAMEVAASSHHGYQGLPGGAAETFLCAAVVMVVLRLEHQRRARVGLGIGSHLESCRQLLKECVPEAAGLMACLTLAAALRARGDAEHAGDETWEMIKAQWPLLLGADSLLSLQAMLRLVVLLSVVFRAGSGGSVPLSEEATTLWLGANAARLLLLSRTTTYMLDGPLGGMLPVACEVAVMPILLVLSRGTLRRAALSLALALAVAACFASRNYLALAGNNSADALFMLAHSLDFLAALAYLFRTVLIDHGTKGVSVGFAHLLMPIQQGLAAYYFLQAFEVTPELAGAGLPFEVLQLSSTMAFGAYLGAAVLHFADGYDGRSRHEHQSVFA